jgi:hypothetical protein
MFKAMIDYYFCLPIHGDRQERCHATQRSLLVSCYKAAPSHAWCFERRGIASAACPHVALSGLYQSAVIN